MDAATEAASLGRKARNDGDLAAARHFYAEAAEVHREANDLLAYAYAIRHIADIHRQEGNGREAKPLYEEALELYRSSLDTKLLDLANTVRAYALLLEEEGNLESAKTLWEEAKSLYGSLRIDAGVSECSDHLVGLRLR